MADFVGTPAKTTPDSPAEEKAAAEKAAADQPRRRLTAVCSCYGNSHPFLCDARNGDNLKRSLTVNWEHCTPAEAHASLAKPDVVVTNASDKAHHLPKILQLDRIVRAEFGNVTEISDKEWWGENAVTAARAAAARIQHP